VVHPQHLAIGLCQAVGTILHTPPGATIHLSRGPTFPADGIASFIILQIQATVTDMIVVLSPSEFYPSIRGH